MEGASRRTGTESVRPVAVTKQALVAVRSRSAGSSQRRPDCVAGELVHRALVHAGQVDADYRSHPTALAGQAHPHHRLCWVEPEHRGDD